jgi:hypothetical protein
MDLSSLVQGLRNFPENQPVLLTKFLNLKTAENFLTGKSAGFADLSTVVVTRWKMIKNDKNWHALF